MCLPQSAGRSTLCSGVSVSPSGKHEVQMRTILPCQPCYGVWTVCIGNLVQYCTRCETQGKVVNYFHVTFAHKHATRRSSRMYSNTHLHADCSTVLTPGADVA